MYFFIYVTWCRLDSEESRNDSPRFKSTSTDLAKHQKWPPSEETVLTQLRE